MTPGTQVVMGALFVVLGLILLAFPPVEGGRRMKAMQNWMLRSLARLSSDSEEGLQRFYDLLRRPLCLLVVGVGVAFVVIGLLR